MSEPGPAGRHPGRRDWGGDGHDSLHHDICHSGWYNPGHPLAFIINYFFIIHEGGTGYTPLEPGYQQD